PFLWVEVGDAPGPASERGLIERGAIAVLSNFARPPIDPPSPTWLGHRSAHEAIRNSGLWNVNHVRDTASDDAFVHALARHLD
ncbi:MAG: hypothetical protein WCG47_20150, partial [Dermatophilaceae bacterium]